MGGYTHGTIYYKNDKLIFLPSGTNSGRVSVDDESGESFAGRTLRVGIRSGQDEVVAGHASVGDPE